uniref:Uncharacterized protein n=1 Tax=Trichobilharzia regenti TaxID=157069 RepID=A0AA85IWX5_TRIRE|nr:unnamed protein product [Trichobilharzia regenti]
MEQRIKNAVKRLDQLDQRLDDYKPLLEQNVLNAEFEIRANFKNLIELLSKRQSHLLIQLHNISKEKSLLIESNKQKIESLKSLLLQSCLSRSEYDAKINEYLRKAESISLTTDFTPFITFSRENVQLHEFISTFGRLTCRYSGHFADPNKPSICLPRAFEEEDDCCGENNDTRIDYLKHYSAVFNRVKQQQQPEHQQPPSQQNQQCACHDPAVKQWLSLIEHKCKSNRTYDMMSDMYSGKDNNNNNKNSGSTVNTPSLQSNNYSLCDSIFSRKTSSLHNFEVNPSSSAAQSTVHAPCYRPDTTTTGVPNWLKLLDRQQIAEILSYHKGIHECMDGLKSPDDYLDKSASESFDILTNSSQNMSSLKDWLFCDPAELRDMPGLSTNHTRHNEDYYHASVVPSSSSLANNNRSWLIPDNMPSAVVNTKMSTLSINNHQPVRELFPEHLIKPGPIDLSRWLVKKQSSSPVPVPVPSTLATSATLMKYEVEEEQEQEDSMNTQILSQCDNNNDMQISDTDKCCRSVELTTTGQFCPMYGVCQGGPGGPTCCGGAGGGCPLTNKTSMNTTISQQEENQTVSQEGVTESSSLPVSQPMLVSSTTAMAALATATATNTLLIIAELQRIANTDMKQWIRNSSPSSSPSSSSSPDTDCDTCMDCSRHDEPQQQK